jgi:excinuclease ABC subunit C
MCPIAVLDGSTVDHERGANEELFAAKLQSLPPTPGCYLFFDKAGAVLYVGKAKSLRSRVRSYFQEGGSDARYFIPILRRVVADLETVVTSTEKEAAVLENELIKRHQPRFNVKLRDDKDFLCLRIDMTKRWPMLEMVRRPTADGARYFGPYHSATSARRMLHLVNKHFQLRTCSDAEFASRRRPCLQYQIKRCPAPCVYEVDEGWYAEQVEAVRLFLDGRHDELTRELGDRMKQASDDMEFELAAIYRDQLRAVESVRQAQRVVAMKDTHQDVIGLYREGALVELELLQVRSGRVSETLSFSLRGVELPDEEVLAGFIAQHYGGESSVVAVDEVIVPVLPDGADGIAEWLSERRQAAHPSSRTAKVGLVAPRRGPRVELLHLANENAAHSFREKQRAHDDLDARLEELRERLRLPTVPRRIECCDISHHGGANTVGSIVMLRDGQPDKKRYRSFTVKGVTEGDDYAAMYEVLARRFRRGRDAAQSAAASAEAASDVASDLEWELPDLFVVDGGRGQLNVALSAAHDLGLHGLAMVGLAKERETVTGDKIVDRVYLPGQKNGIPLRSSSTALFFLARARDEAHRFANHARTRLGRGKTLRSALDDVAGIGPVARKALLKTLGSLDGVRRATDSEILTVPGVTRRHLVSLRKIFPAPAEVASALPPPSDPDSSEGEG